MKNRAIEKKNWRQITKFQNQTSTAWKIINENINTKSKDHDLGEKETDGFFNKNFIELSIKVSEVSPHFLRFTAQIWLQIEVTWCAPSSLSLRSRFFSSSSAMRADALVLSPDFWLFSMMEQARSTNDGTVSCFSCLGMSTSVQYCVSNRITSWERELLNFQFLLLQYPLVNK